MAVAARNATVDRGGPISDILCTRSHYALLKMVADPPALAKLSQADREATLYIAALVTGEEDG